MSQVRLQVRDISKNFGITKALQHVSFDVNAGEVHALIGENGSGKSTLTNMLTGIYPMETGTFILDGKEIHPLNQVDANNMGISIIVQELGTLSGLTVAENIFLGHEDRFIKHGFRNTVAMNAEANRLLQEYGFTHIKGGAMIDNYNFEDRKLIEIVKATYFHPKIVVIDETTTALSQEGREELYKQMERLKAEGCTVIFISHDLSEILSKSDTITILRDGIYIDTLNAFPGADHATLPRGPKHVLKQGTGLLHTLYSHSPCMPPPTPLTNMRTRGSDHCRPRKTFLCPDRVHLSP